MIACIERLLPGDILQFPYIARVKQAVFVRGKAWNDSKRFCDKNVMFLQQIKSKGIHKWEVFALFIHSPVFTGELLQTFVKKKVATYKKES